MSKVLGLDLGTNSIGWAIADTATNQPLQCGVIITPYAHSVNYVGELIKRIYRHYNIIPDSITITHHRPRSLQGLSLNRQRSLKRTFRRVKQRFIHRLAYWLQLHATDLFKRIAIVSKIKKLAPLLIHALLAVLFIGSLLMAILHQKDFQFWFNLSITVLLAWIATKK